MAKYSFKVYFDNIPKGHRPMWIYTMYAGMSTGKCNQIQYTLTGPNIKIVLCLWGNFE